MTSPDEFFDLLRRDGGFAYIGKKTNTGRNVYERRAASGELIEVTANFARRDDRVSTKLTINKRGANMSMRLYHKLKAASPESSLNGKVEWSPNPEKAESKLQVRHEISALADDVAAIVAWAAPNLTALIAQAKAL